MDLSMSLSAASAATGQSVDRLRTWCATGKLRCDRDGDEWLIPVAELVRVAGLLEEREKSIEEGRAQVLVVPVASAAPDLREEVARCLGLPAGAVTTSMLALDGTEFVLAVWKADGPPKLHELGPVLDLAEELGGELLDGEVKRGWGD